jgi:hypothetical protein
MRMIQYTPAFIVIMDGAAYWMPRLKRGMTAENEEERTQCH